MSSKDVPVFQTLNVKHLNEEENNRIIKPRLL